MESLLPFVQLVAIAVAVPVLTLPWQQLPFNARESRDPIADHSFCLGINDWFRHPVLPWAGPGCPGSSSRPAACSHSAHALLTQPVGHRLLQHGRSPPWVSAPVGRPSARVKAQADLNYKNTGVVLEGSCLPFPEPPLPAHHPLAKVPTCPHPHAIGSNNSASLQLAPSSSRFLPTPTSTGSQSHLYLPTPPPSLLALFPSLPFPLSSRAFVLRSLLLGLRQLSRRFPIHDNIYSTTLKSLLCSVIRFLFPFYSLDRYPRRLPPASARKFQASYTVLRFCVSHT